MARQIAKNIYSFRGPVMMYMVREMAMVIAGFLAIGLGPAWSQQLAIISSPQVQQDEYNQNWQRHIDNKAYLERLKQRNSPTARPTPTILFIDKRRERPSPQQGCAAPNSNGWAIEYHNGSTSIIYREGYRPNRLNPVYLRPSPHHRKLSFQPRRQEGRSAH